jgi:XTP/dITP diphosphohydrolase
MCLADDSGLEITVLGGKPGVISSHYCTDGRDAGMGREERDAANNRKVLMQMEEVPPEKRGARFVCVMALATGGRILTTVRGVLEGRIGVPPAVPRGDNGFGYDPLFLVGPDNARTGAELSPEEKNRISHRARAAKEMAARVAALLKEGRLGG